MLAGIGFTVVAAGLYNAGLVCEKRALGDLPEVHARHSVKLIRVLMRSRAWMIGFSCMLAGLLCQIAGLALAPIFVVQPIFASGVLVLVILARISLHERLGPAEWAGVLVLVLGISLIGLSLGGTAGHVGSRIAPASVVTFTLLTVVTAGVAFAAANGSHQAGREVRAATAVLFGLAAGLMYGCASLAGKAIAAVVDQRGALNAIPHVLASPYLYLLAGTLALGFVLFQTGLQRCAAAVIVPTSTVVSSGYLVGVGTVLFGEHLPAHWQLESWIVGFVWTAVGIVLLAAGPQLARGRRIRMIGDAGPLIEPDVSAPTRS
jgi:drug/metabolite transporter (DMT)-like permease